MSSLEEIGALLGFAAFAGLAVLVFLTFQQARHLRRLRDWAGRAPERAAAAAAREAGIEEPEAAGQPVSEQPRPPRFAALRTRAEAGWSELDRHMPVDPRVLLAGIAAILLGVGIATGAFGLLGDEDGDDRQSEAARSGKGSGGKGSGGGAAGPSARVAVLNGTAPPGGEGVAGVADRASEDVKAAGFKVGAIDNAGSFAASVVMFSGSAEAEAEQLADELSSRFGSIEVIAMTPEVEALAGGADVALVVGQDDAGL